jgi:hypothetical protein
LAYPASNLLKGSGACCQCPVFVSKSLRSCALTKTLASALSMLSNVRRLSTSATVTRRPTAQHDECKSTTGGLLMCCQCIVQGEDSTVRMQLVLCQPLGLCMRPCAVKRDGKHFVCMHEVNAQVQQHRQGARTNDNSPVAGQAGHLPATWRRHVHCD